MNWSEFKDAFNTLKDQQIKMMEGKSQDYAGDIDRFANFRVAATATGLTPEQIMLVMIAIKLTRLSTLLGSGKTPVNESMKDSAFAEGIIGERQLSELGSQLTTANGQLIVVYLHHHPFYRSIGTPLVDAQELMAILEDKTSILLFGHRHVSELWIGQHGIPYMLASGRVTTADQNGILRYRKVLIENGQVEGIYTEEIKAREREAA